jgi:SAM-dependent methyltransferase
MNEEHQMIDLQVDHPDVDDLQQDFRPGSIRAHVLSLIHRWPYEQLMVQAKDKNVLELGCNKGFGTVIYAEHASSVKAVDTSSGAIEKARKLNARENIEYICLDSWTLPFADNAFDLVVLFQVIEHIALDKLDIFLREIKRVTRMDGQVFFTTPNRDIRLLPFQMPRNKFHTREYSAQDLGKLLSRYFVEARVEGLFGEEALNEIERRRVRQRPGKGQAKSMSRRH